MSKVVVDVSVFIMIALFHLIWIGMAIGIVAFVRPRKDNRRNDKVASSGVAYIENLVLMVLLALSIPVAGLLSWNSSSSRETVASQRDGDRLSGQPTVALDNTALGDELSSDANFDFIQSGGNADGSARNSQDPSANSPQGQSVVGFLSGTFWISLERSAPWIALAYLFGMVLMIGRFSFMLIGSHRMMLSARPICDSHLTTLVADSARRIGLAFVPVLAVSQKIAVPVVIGIWRPMILVPSSLITGLSVQDLEMILVHELAHIRRHDQWVVMLQRLVEAILFFHPTTWYLSSRLNRERELRCDDTVLALGSSPLAYASSLCRVAEIALALKVSNRVVDKLDPIALAATGTSDAQLLDRVRRLLGEAGYSLSTPSPRFSKAVIASIAAFAVFIGVVAIWYSANSSKQNPPDALGDSSQAIFPYEQEGSSPKTERPQTSNTSPRQDETKIEAQSNPKRSLEKLRGRVLNRADSQPVPNIDIQGLYTDRQATENLKASRDDQLMTNESGEFDLERQRFPILLRAQSKDGKTGGFVEVAADADEVTLFVGPLKLVTGKLTNAKTGLPLSDMEVVAEKRFAIEDGGHHSTFPTATRTDANGVFRFEGLITDSKFYLSLTTEKTETKDKRSRTSKTLRDFTIDPNSEQLDLGIMKCPLEEISHVDGSGTSIGQEDKTISFSGKCHDENGNAVENIWARVFRVSEDFDGSPSLLAHVRSMDGEFSFSKIEKTPIDAQTRKPFPVILVVTADGYSTWAMPIDQSKENETLSIKLSSDVALVEGVVSDVNGKPIKGVSLNLYTGTYQFIPECRSAVTDENGHYQISMNRWKPEDTKVVEPGTRVTTMQSGFFMILRHPDYAQTRAAITRVPQELNVTFVPPALIEGTVIDEVTKKTIPNVLISAQSVGHGYWHQARANEDGRYQLRVNKDHYNIWADVDDRIAVAAKNVAAESGKTIKQADIRMVRGGFVVGTVTDAATGKPISPTKDAPISVGHYGPARPRSGAGIKATPVNPDGTYRLRVAPGTNYVYVPHQGGSRATVEVKEGEEVKLDLQMGVERGLNPDDEYDPDLLLRNRLREEARREENVPPPKVRGNQEPTNPQVEREQSSSSASKDADDKYRFDKKDYPGDRFKAFEAAAALLKVAIADGAPELAIAKLRVDTATTAFQCRRDGEKDWDLILQTIKPVITDPSPLLVNFDSAKYCVEAVGVYAAALGATATDVSLPETAIQQAMEKVAAAMAMTDRERFVLAARLRQSGSLLAQRQGDQKKAADWLGPVLENRKWMIQDDYGADLLNTISILHAKFNVKLGRIDDGLASVREQAKEIKTNSDLSDARKMELIDSLLLSYLVTFRDDASSPGAAAAWQEVQNHIAEMETYSGDDAPAIQLSVLVIRREMLKYFPSRDFDESIRIVDQMLRQVLAHPELANDMSQALGTFSSWCTVLKKLIEADDPRHHALREQLTGFIVQLKKTDIDAITISMMERGLREIK